MIKVYISKTPENIYSEPVGYKVIPLAVNELKPAQALTYFVCVKERYPSGRQFGAVFSFITKPTARKIRFCVKLGKQAIRKAEQRVNGELVGVRESD